MQNDKSRSMNGWRSIHWMDRIKGCMQPGKSSDEMFDLRLVG